MLFFKASRSHLMVTGECRVEHFASKYVRPDLLLLIRSRITSLNDHHSANAVFSLEVLLHFFKGASVLFLWLRQFGSDGYNRSAGDVNLKPKSAVCQQRLSTLPRSSAIVAAVKVRQLVLRSRISLRNKCTTRVHARANETSESGGILAKTLACRNFKIFCITVGPSDCGGLTQNTALYQ